MARLQKLYEETIHEILNSKFKYKNKHEAPKITKIVLLKPEYVLESLPFK